MSITTRMDSIPSSLPVAIIPAALDMPVKAEQTTTTLNHAVEKEQENPKKGSLQQISVKKVEQIFQAREAIRKKINTDKKIKNIVATILIIIGLTAVVLAFALGFPATIPFGAAAGLYAGGSALVWITAYFAQDKWDKVSEKQERKFWDVLSKPLSEMTKERMNYYHVGSPYYGQVTGISRMTYIDLIGNEILTESSAKTLESILDRQVWMDGTLSSEKQSLNSVKNMTEDEKCLIHKRSEQKYAKDKEILESEFEEFRNQFIEETHKKYVLAH